MKGKETLMNTYTNLAYNIYTQDLSPSAISKNLPNCKNLDDIKHNRVYETIKPITLYIGNTLHEVIDWNNGNLLDTLDFVKTARGYQNGEYSMTYKQATKNDTTINAMDKLHHRLLVEGLEWLDEVVLDSSIQKYEMFINKVQIGHRVYSGTADVVQDNGDGTFSVFDFKCYNGVSEKETQSHFNQLMIYAIMIQSYGFKISSIAIYNPIMKTVQTRVLTDEIVQDFIDTQLLEI
jgi:hypothetical protein